MKIRILIVITWLLFFCVAPRVNAQSVDVSVSPPHLEIMIKPGISLIQAIDLKNYGDPAAFSTKVVSFIPKGDKGGRELKEKAEGPLRFSLENSDIQLGDTFFLDTNKTAQALLKIRATNNAPEGDYYYTLFFISEPPVSQQTASRARVHIGANILVSVTESGLLAQEGKIAQFQVIPDYKLRLFNKTYYFTESTRPVKVLLSVANTGKNLITPRAVISLRGPFLGTKKQQLLPLNILQNSQRILYDEADECSQCTIQPSAEFPGFFMGRYILSADVEFEGSNKKIYGTGEFWALPLNALKITFLLFVTGVMATIYIQKKRKHKKH